MKTSTRRRGPGGHLKNLLHSLGIRTDSGCSCKSMVASMDRWGVAGCREHADEIIQHMRDGAAGRSWVEKVRAGAMAVATGLAFALDPFDPFPGLLEEALRRAEESSE